MVDAFVGDSLSSMTGGMFPEGLRWEDYVTDEDFIIGWIDAPDVMVAGACERVDETPLWDAYTAQQEVMR